ncbi:MAG: acyl-CoA thioesterase [Glaciecola sp.]|jgi:acyl-CoA thioesterase|uniref:thioesterase family protein n=1 Tax=Congregibacter sp. TaxID=2744308 RepID=UPI0039E6826E
MSFEKATAIDSTQQPYTAEIAEGWDIVGNANGGYLLALGARAMARAAGRPHPITVTAHYLAPGKPGPVTIDPQVIKAGKRLTTVRATLQSPDKPLIELLGSFADLESFTGPARVDASPPDLPPPDQCVRSVPNPERGFPPAMMGRVDLRLHPDDAEFLRGKPSGDPLIRGWLRFPDNQPMDPFGLLLATDGFPPTIFNANLPVAWTPTVELTAHIRAIPEPGWLRCRFSTRFISGGMMEEDGEVWDSSGRLVAQSRQLALTPRS